MISPPDSTLQSTHLITILKRQSLMCYRNSRESLHIFPICITRVIAVCNVRSELEIIKEIHDYKTALCVCVARSSQCSISVFTVGM